MGILGRVEKVFNEVRDIMHRSMNHSFETVVLDDTLEPIPSKLKNDREQLILSGTKTEQADGKYWCSEQPVALEIAKGDAYHKNFISYLEMCWASHHGAVISPDMIWFHVMNELASHVKDNSEQYRDVFTTASAGEDKINIEMQFDGSKTILNVHTIVDELRKLVPTSIGKFIPEFSTGSRLSRMAIASAFCEAVSPYYSYSVYLCGIPSIVVLGTVEDWEKIAESCNDIGAILPGASSYLKNTAVIAKDIADQVEHGLKLDFWKGIFNLKRCGSGSQVEVEGWIRRLYMSKPSPAFTSNFPTHITRVPFDVKGAGSATCGDYILSCGLFTSTVFDGLLVPEFGWILNKKSHERLEIDAVKEKAKMLANVG